MRFNIFKRATKKKSIPENLAFGGTAATWETLGDTLKDFSNSEKTELLAGFVYVCIDVISDRVATLEPNYQKDGETVDWNGWEILNRETIIGYFPDKIKLAVMDYMALGRAYFYTPRTTGGRIMGFYNLPAGFVTMKQQEGISSITDIPQEYIVGIGGYQYRVPANEIISIRNPDLFNFLKDKAFIDAYKYSILVNFDIDKYLIQTFGERNVGKSVVLTTDQQLGKAEAERIRAEWKQRYSELKSTGDVAVLGSGVHLDKISMTPKEVGYLASKSLLVKHLLGLFKVPPSILGMTEGINRANAEANEYTFSKYAIEPIARKFETVFSYKLANPPREQIKFKGAIQRDKEFQHQVAVDMTKLGAVTLNYIRKINGLPEDPRFDITIRDLMNEGGKEQ